MKILLWIVLVAAALLVLRMINIAGAKRRAGEGRGDAGKKAGAEPMIRCARCGVYLPRAEAVSSPGGLVCGEKACLERR